LLFVIMCRQKLHAHAIESHTYILWSWIVSVFVRFTKVELITVLIPYQNIVTYCKIYFRCNLISRFWNVEISLQFNFMWAVLLAQLCEASCLHYLLPEERDSSVTDRLRHAKTWLLNTSQPELKDFKTLLSHIACDIMISLGPILYWLCCSNPATGCYTK